MNGWNILLWLPRVCVCLAETASGEGASRTQKGIIPAIDCPRGGESPLASHGLIQIAVQQDEQQGHLIYITVWGSTAEGFEKGKEIVQMLLEVDFATKQKKQGGSRVIQSNGIYPHHKAPCQAINLEKMAGEWQLTAWGRAGHWSPSGQQLCCAPLGLYIPLPLLLFSLPFLT